MNYDLSTEVINDLCDLVENDLDALKHACGDEILLIDNDNWSVIKKYIEGMQDDINIVAGSDGELKNIILEMKKNQF